MTGEPRTSEAGPSWWPAFLAELLANTGLAGNPYNQRLLERMTAELEGDVLAVTLPSPPLRLYVEPRLSKYWEGAVQWS